MATYKVIQDIEAEDKLLGPLTLKQFIFAGISVAFGFVAYMIASKTTVYASIPFLPFIIIPAILAFPFNKDQPTDMWLAYRIRFFIKPRKRIWDQSGLKDLVNITVPKKEKHIYSDGLSERQVRSRLKALADTEDSRGWVVKNVDINLYNASRHTINASDRLIDPNSIPPLDNDVEAIDIRASDDILDADNNPLAQHLDQLMQKSSQQYKNSAIQKMQAIIDNKTNATNTTDQITDNKPKQPNVVDYREPIEQADTQSQPTTQEMSNLLKQAKQHSVQSSSIQPHHKKVMTPQELEKAQAMTPPKNPDIVNLAKTDDLLISSLASLANRKSQYNQEVVINLR